MTRVRGGTWHVVCVLAARCCWGSGEAWGEAPRGCCCPIAAGCWQLHHPLLHPGQAGFGFSSPPGNPAAQIFFLQICGGFFFIFYFLIFFTAPKWSVKLILFFPVKEAVNPLSCLAISVRVFSHCAPACHLCQRPETLASVGLQTWISLYLTTQAPLD